MYRLYYNILCPFSRKTRIHLLAKGLSFDLVQENIIEKRKEFIAMNPSGELPILVDNSNSAIICTPSAIVEYIEEKHSDERNFIGDSIVSRAENRRLQHWFDNKFYYEVLKPLLDEKYFSRFLPEKKSPDSSVLRVARHNLSVHLSYVEYLLETNKYLASDEISLSDFSAFAHISILDYFGDINWNYHRLVRDWYCLVKSHKISAEVLKDRVSNINPPDYYSKLDW
jgi:glutathione S-transferase